MRLLSVIDQLFLLLENSRQPMHIGGLFVFDAPIHQGEDDDGDQDFVATLVDQIRHVNSLPAYPFNQVLYKLTFWKTITDFDINQHFYHVTLSEPISEQALLSYVSSKQAEVLDKDYPLWECHLIQGRSSYGAAAPQQFALYVKIHHSLLDGVAAMTLLQQSLSASPYDRIRLPPWSLMSRHAKPDPHIKQNPSSQRTVLGRRLGQVFKPRPGAPVFDASVNASVIDAPIQAIALAYKKRARKLLTAQSTAKFAKYDAPISILNQRISEQRQFITHSYALSRLKAIATSGAVSLNDVLLALCSGALRRYLLRLNELPSKPLIALIPTSMRDNRQNSGGHGTSADGGAHNLNTDYREDMGNHLAFILCDLGTQLPLAKQRLDTIHKSMEVGKDLLSQMSQAEFIGHAITTYGLDGVNLMTELYPTKQAFNLVISNVIGSPQPLYWNGAKLKHVYPASVILSGLALNITLISYEGKLEFGIVACPQALPNFEHIITALDEELICLEKEV